MVDARAPAPAAAGEGARRARAGTAATTPRTTLAVKLLSTPQRIVLGTTPPEGSAMSATGYRASGWPASDRRRRLRPAVLLTHLVLIAASLSILLPVLWTLRTSFAASHLAYRPADLRFAPTLDNYAKLFVAESFQKYFWNDSATKSLA